MKLITLLGMLLAFLLVPFASGCPDTQGMPAATAEAPAGTLRPTETPDAQAFDPEIVFTTVDMNGASVSEEAFAGHALTMINLWAYWCGPCVGEMPDIEQLYEDYRDRGLMVWGISDEEYEEDNLAVIAELGITYPCLRYVSAFDPWMQTGYIPTTIFVDASGKVVGEVCVGGRDYASWAAVVEELLP